MGKRVWTGLRLAAAAVYMSAAVCISAAAADPAGEEGIESGRSEARALTDYVMARALTDVYLRSGPSPEDTAIATLHRGEEVSVRGNAGGSWVGAVLVRDGKSIEGYLNSRYLDLQEDIASLLRDGAYSDADAESSGSDEERTDKAADEKAKPPASKEYSEKTAAGSPEKTEDGDGGSEGGDGRFLWIGDSRTEGMELYVKQDIYCAAESADYKWLTGEGEGVVKEFLDEYRGDTVLLNLGINDLSDGEAYISYYRRLISLYPEQDFYVVSLGPVNEGTEVENGYCVTNAEVENINREFEKAFPDRYLDIYHWLREKGFASNDGVHYTPSECRQISLFVHLALGVRRFLSRMGAAPLLS